MGVGGEEEEAQATGGQAMWLCPAEAHSFSPETLGSGALELTEGLRLVGK